MKNFNVVLMIFLYSTVH